ncbi:MAG: hypothetical protein HC836_33620 [Richelia sp. RM2_1_2]|nr:hypothetical protein [Richelia sp. RM2_1_2]
MTQFDFGFDILDFRWVSPGRTIKNIAIAMVSPSMRTQRFKDFREGDYLEISRISALKPLNL